MDSAASARPSWRPACARLDGQRRIWRIIDRRVPTSQAFERSQIRSHRPPVSAVLPLTSRPRLHSPDRWSEPGIRPWPSRAAWSQFGRSFGASLPDRGLATGLVGGRTERPGADRRQGGRRRRRAAVRNATTGR
jgi:hypothetical protein